MAIKLSILIPSVSERRDTFLPSSLSMLYGQLEKLPKEKRDQVEVLYLVDNKTMMLGHKRNCLVDIAQGEYVVHVDDDDVIDPDYVETLLDATKTGSDVINFKVSVSLNGEDPKICHYSKQFEKDYNTEEAYFRLPNHICCVKKSIAGKVAFPNIKNGEDSVYSKLLKPFLNTEHDIEKVLYHYYWNAQTTVAQEDMPYVQNLRNRPAVVDIVFLSHAKNDRFKRMTEKAIETCISGANGIPVNIIIAESQKGVEYKYQTIYLGDKPFHYNGFANHCLKYGKAKYVMVANNDLLFHDGWLKELINTNYPVVSPFNPGDPRQKEITKNTVGTVNGKHFSGWCFMMSRSLWKRIGGLPEITNFWFSDNATIKEVEKLGIKPMIVRNSIVKHLGSTTLKTIDKVVHNDFTWGQCKVYNDHYNDNLFESNPHYRSYLKRTS